MTVHAHIPPWFARWRHCVFLMNGFNSHHICSRTHLLPLYYRSTHSIYAVQFQTLRAYYLFYIPVLPPIQRMVALAWLFRTLMFVLYQSVHLCSSFDIFFLCCVLTYLVLFLLCPAALCARALRILSSIILKAPASLYLHALRAFFILLLRACITLLFSHTRHYYPTARCAYRRHSTLLTFERLRGVVALPVACGIFFTCTHAATDVDVHGAFGVAPIPQAAACGVRLPTYRILRDIGYGGYGKQAFLPLLPAARHSWHLRERAA